VAALTARLSSAAAAAAGLALTRVSAVPVSWHSAGTPLFVYTTCTPAAAAPAADSAPAATAAAPVPHTVDQDADHMLDAMRAACSGLDGTPQFRALLRVSMFHGRAVTA
jgi:hypothetical protein